MSNNSQPITELVGERVRHDFTHEAVGQITDTIQDLEFYTKDGEPIDFIHLEHLDKIMELFNKYNGTVDFTAPKVNLIDIASPNMTPEASKAVSEALERSAETMDNAVKEAENIRLTRAKPVENKELPTAVTVKNVLKMVVAHTQSNKQDFLNASLDVAKELELNGEQELADYIYAQFKLIRTFEVND